MNHHVQTQNESMPIDHSLCEEEQIHLIDSVQPHGALLVLEEPTLKILQASEHAYSILHHPDASLHGKLLEDLVSEPSVEQIRKILDSHQSGDFWPVVPCPLTAKESKYRLQGLLHKNNGVCILELEQHYEPDNDAITSLANWISVDFPRVFAAADMSVLLERAATEVHKLSGYDRVLIYKFNEEWHGTVVAEEKRDFMNSYLNHWFPASDIPPQARDLYSKNYIRLLADANGAPNPITPAINPLTGNRLDMTYSVLRSMSAVHIEYLKNMGISASMSISLIVRGKLWGLIACHHKTPRIVDFKTRSLCELVGKVLSGLIGVSEEHTTTAARLKLKLEHDRIAFTLAKSENLQVSLREQIQNLTLVTNARGTAIVGDNILELHGTTPDKETIQELFHWLQHSFHEELFCSDRLALEFPQWRKITSQASGLLAINIPAMNQLWIMWFRPEQIEEICWAGNPHKSVEIDSYEGVIHPRKSFEMWTERVHGRSLPWKSFEREEAQLLQGRIIALMLAQILRDEAVNKSMRQQREDMLAFLTHDLTIHVVAMDRVLSILLDDKTGKIPQDIREILHILDSANQDQRARIKKVMQVLLYELNNEGFIPVEIDCAEIIRESVAELILQPEQNAQISCTINHNEYGFTSDRESIKRLLRNLIDNALRATGTQGHVHVSCEFSREGLTVKVSDDGPGIAQDDQKLIFERFWQGGKTTYAPRIGTGLYLCKRIVDRLAGTISFECVPGKGTCFTVFVPNS